MENKTIGDTICSIDKHNANNYIKSYIEVLADFINSYDYDLLTQIKRGEIISELKRCKRFISNN